MSKPGEKYCPSNGTEGEYFMEKFCYHCIHDNGDKVICPILMASMSYYPSDPKFPKEWIYDGLGNPTCTNHKRWDWGKDDDGNWIEPPLGPTDDPNQLCFPFIMDEIGVPKSQELKSEPA